MRDALRAFSNRLADAGVRCETHEVANMFHAFPFLLPWTHESQEVYREVGHFIGSTLATHREARAFTTS
jgi:acetyl esterase/lipase